MAKAAAFNARLRVFADRALSPEAQSRRLAEIAITERDRLIAAGRATRRYRRWVDGVEGAPETAVRPADGGRIVYRFSILGAVCTFALSFLINRSPPRSSAPLNPATGKTAHYRDGFYFGIKDSSSAHAGKGDSAGRFVPAAQFNAAALSPTVTEIIIGNNLPYSRKVDVQLIGGEALSFSVPPGLFDDAVKAIRSRWGDVVEVRRVYTMDFPNQYRLKQRQVWTTGKRKGLSRGRVGTRVESPAIIIKPRR
ncbi:hypothetical protein [Azospirillum picis]|uniref:Uncharacterized protein n=1 Tax=Azospirillum picis TaxID=488438 RepID=A0ABU0MRX8_9PROT|nr:hypothetical protein [Azospirillum picis]MBP2302518.1 hypothetical protein [Azospirillum picis]MDQ0536240.1 hypothetical protein [Azospirillum picis]